MCASKMATANIFPKYCRQHRHKWSSFTIFGVTRSSSSVAAGLENDDTNLSQVEGLVNLTRKQFAGDENLDHTTFYLSFWDCDVGLATIFDFLGNPMNHVGFEGLLRQNKKM